MTAVLRGQARAASWVVLFCYTLLLLLAPLFHRCSSITDGHGENSVAPARGACGGAQVGSAHGDYHPASDPFCGVCALSRTAVACTGLVKAVSFHGSEFRSRVPAPTLVTRTPLALLPATRGPPSA